MQASTKKPINNRPEEDVAGGVLLYRQSMYPVVMMVVEGGRQPTIVGVASPSFCIRYRRNCAVLFGGRLSFFRLFSMRHCGESKMHRAVYSLQLAPALKNLKFSPRLDSESLEFMLRMAVV